MVQQVWSPVYLDALVLRDRDADGNSANGLEERIYVQQDANWNVTALVTLVETTWQVVERYNYDPYGLKTVLNASWATLPGTSYAWKDLFQGRRLEDASGMYHFRNRDLNSLLMRWNRLDPIGLSAGDLNLYRYVSNTPVGLNDPLGLAVFIRCYRVHGGHMHCGIIVRCKDKEVSFDGGGSITGSGSSMPRPGRNEPAEHVPGEVIHVVDESDKACLYDLACLERAFREITQAPYHWWGPNSNTYAHALLSRCSRRCPTPRDAPGWNQGLEYYQDQRSDQRPEIPRLGRR